MADKTSKQKILLWTIIWVFVSCLSGLATGYLLSPAASQPPVVITQQNVYELAITQVIGGSTYTPYPTFTPLFTAQHTSTPIATLPPFNFISTAEGYGLSAADDSAPFSAPTPTPTETSFELVFLSWTVNIQTSAFARIRTVPEANCMLIYTDPKGETAFTSGMFPQKPDEHGECSWTWWINQEDGIGTGIVSITANNATRSYFIQVQNP